MINIIWFIILALGIVFGLITGNGEAVSKSIISSTDFTVKFIIGFVGLMCLWCGVMEIAKESGLTEKLAKLIKPILKVIFKNAAKDEKAVGAMVMNLTANMMGLSNAATPFGIKAMEELQRINCKKDTASNDMVLFIILNTACIQLIPTTVISIRAAAGSKNPGEIIIPAVIATGVSAIVGVLCCKVLENYF